MPMKWAWGKTLPTSIGGKGAAGYPVSPVFIKAKYTVNSKDFDLVANNLEVTGNLVTEKAIKATALIAIDLLRNAQPTVPIASSPKGNLLPGSGRLRRSGKATVLYRGGKEIADVARGRTDGGVDVDLSTLKTAKGFYRMAHTISSRVTYHRTNAQGEDIALWAHEELLGWIPRPGGKKPGSLYGYYVARRKGTGPKYLESPWLTNKGKYLSYLKKVLSGKAITKDIESIAKYINVSGRGRVPQVRLNYYDITSILNGMSI